MAYQDVYQVVLHQEYYSQGVLNVFFYQDGNPSSTATALDLAGAFLLGPSIAVRNFQTTAVKQTRIVVENLFNPSDRADSPISIVGSRTNLDAVPAFVSVGFTLGHTNGSVRPGSKRFAGLDESDVANGVIVSTAAVSTLNALAAALVQQLIVTAVTTFVPVVVKRILTPSGDYRLPATLSELVAGVITSAIWKVLATSQVTRKIGVGV